MKNPISKERISHEAAEFLAIFLFVAPFVVCLASYRLYLMPAEGALFAYTTALVNALAVSKIMMTVDMAKLGKSSENKPLIVPTLHKAAIMTLLYLGFRVMETTVHGLRQGQSLLNALGGAFVRGQVEFVILGLVTFFAAVPGFALHELRRAIGANNFRALFFGAGRMQRLSESTSGGSAVQL